MIGEILSFGQPVASYFGGQADKNSAAHAARQNYAQQKEFAQSGIQWKVEDAKRAGLHPLAALGVSTPMTSGTHKVGAQSPGGALADSMSSMSQNIGRAINASATAEQRQMSQLQIANAKAELDGKVIDNQIRASHLQNLNSTGPAFPSANDTPLIPGQGNSMPGVRIVPSESVASEKRNPGVQAGLINSIQYTREASGNLGIAPSQQAKERIEDDIIGQPLWHIKNRLSPPPPSTSDYPIPPHLSKKGYKYWYWNPFKQEFVPSKNP